MGYWYSEVTRISKSIFATHIDLVMTNIRFIQASAPTYMQKIQQSHRLIQGDSIVMFINTRVANVPADMAPSGRQRGWGNGCASQVISVVAHPVTPGVFYIVRIRYAQRFLAIRYCAKLQKRYRFRLIANTRYISVFTFLEMVYQISVSVEYRRRFPTPILKRVN